MADIDVERKKTSIWPWVLGLLLLAGLLWAVMEMLGDDDDDAVVTEQPTVVAPDSPTAAPMAAVTDPAVEQYTSECTSVSETRDEMSLEHEYEANCIRLLSAALAAVVERDTVGSTAVQSAMEEYRQRADALEQTPETSPEHSNMVRDVAISATDVMARVQETRPTAAPTLADEVSQARTAAEAIRDGTPLMEQRRDTGRFFEQAGEALRLLAQR